MLYTFAKIHNFIYVKKKYIHIYFRLYINFIDWKRLYYRKIIMPNYQYEEISTKRTNMQKR